MSALQKTGQLLILSILVSFFIVTGYFTERTGLWQETIIDTRDTSWKRNADGVMTGAESILLNGTRTCWLLIHGYGSTPAEFQLVAPLLHNSTNATILVPLLPGHGTLPSDLQTTTWNDWNTAVVSSYDSLNSSCDTINVAGSSLGGALAVQLSQERPIHTLALIAPYTKAKKQLDQTLINTFGGVLHYVKKTKIAAINNETTRQLHRAYWNLPLKPLQQAREQLRTVEQLTPRAQLFIVILAEHDNVINNNVGETYYERFKGKKALQWLPLSDHVASLDYDYETVAETVEKNT